LHKTDFVIDSKYTFEVGGQNKSKNQIEGIDDSFIVQDLMLTQFIKHTPEDYF